MYPKFDSCFKTYFSKRVRSRRNLSDFEASWSNEIKIKVANACGSVLPTEKFKVKRDYFVGISSEFKIIYRTWFVFVFFLLEVGIRRLLNVSVWCLICLIKSISYVQSINHASERVFSFCLIFCSFHCK